MENWSMRQLENTMEVFVLSNLTETEKEMDMTLSSDSSVAVDTGSNGGGSLIHKKEMDKTLSSDSSVAAGTINKDGSSLIHEKEKEMGTTLSSDSSVVAGTGSKGGSSHEDIGKGCFDPFWFLMNVDTLADEHGKPCGFFFVIRGHPVNTFESTIRFQRKRVGLKKKTVFVGKLPKTMEDGDFKNLFSQYGTILEHGIVRDSTINESVGFGFIIFSSKEEAAALAKKAKRDPIRLEGRKIKIRRGNSSERPIDDKRIRWWASYE